VGVDVVFSSIKLVEFALLLMLFVLRGEVRCRGRPGSRSLFLSRQEK
jgi:hypothetical protein